MPTDVPAYIPCSSCAGTGKSGGHVSHVRGHYWGEIPCHDCAGWGEVEADLPARREAAYRLTEDRQRRDMSLREEAKRLGISAVELSSREHPKTARATKPGAWDAMNRYFDEREKTDA